MRVACAVAALGALLQLAVSAPPGRTPPPVPEWASSFTDGGVLQRIIDSAIDNKAATVRIPAGEDPVLLAALSGPR